jgi:glutathione S-transferase
MAKPVLYVFSISHYCEKARWALDYLDIDYEISHIAPGRHIPIARKLGAPRSSVPILVTQEQLVQGSAEIISWADTAASVTSKRLTPTSNREACFELEKRLDDVIGVHLRRYYYSEALVDHPQTVRPLFTNDLTFPRKMLFRGTWRAVRRSMIKRMDLGHEQGQDSKRIVEGELSWLDGLLSDGRQFLVGNQFSRADITAASLLAPLATPRQHPTYTDLRLPPNLAADLASWEQRPSINWVRETYDRYR